MSAIQKIEAEFEESFSEVIIGFAKMGYSRRTTALACEISHYWMNQLCKRFGLDNKFRQQKDMIDVCRSGYTKGRKSKYSKEYLLSLRRLEETCKEFEQRTGISGGTIRYRFGSWKEFKKI